MGFGELYRDADITSLATGQQGDAPFCSSSLYLAMNIILPEALSTSAYATVITMIDPLRDVVIPQFADAAIVPCCSFAALLAKLTSRLGCRTKHTIHVLSLLSVQTMSLYLVVTVPAREPLTAVEALYLYVALVVHASKRKLFLSGVFSVSLVRTWPRRGFPLRPIARLGFFGAQGVHFLRIVVESHGIWRLGPDV